VSTTVLRVCIHPEQVGPVTVPVPHLFRARPRGSQRLLMVGSEPALVEGDVFTNEAAPDHRSPKAGAFTVPPSGRGRFTAAGQALLLVAGRPVVSRAGSLTTCCTVMPIVPCRTAAFLPGQALLFIQQSPALLGQT
jgi:hypothetical protein